VKNTRRVVLGVLLVTLALCLAAATASAQDPLKVAPNNFKVLLENEQVRVLDFHTKPGEKIGRHSHPAYFTYIISGSGTTKFTSPDGKTTEQENKPGVTTWHNAETHASESTAAVHALLVELKR
jgi:beta-alanine degradation protein BauB